MTTRPRGNANASARRRPAQTTSATADRPSRAPKTSTTTAATAARPARAASRSKPPPFETYPAIVIEGVAPEIDGGRWPIKRVVGDTVQVSADIFKEGHDLLKARVLYRVAPMADSRSNGRARDEWQTAPMEPQGNDSWAGQFVVTDNARYQYTVEAYTDVFGSWQADLEKRLAAHQDVGSDLLEGRRLVQQARERAPSHARRLAEVLRRWIALQGDPAELASLATSAELNDLMAQVPDLSDATRYRHSLELIVDRPAARFGGWYEIFPRSQGTDPTRSATFREAETRLPAIADMGFDVVYLTPIHPIGLTNRKGPNNTLAAGPTDPGSPYAIGSPAGGHDAIAPELGTLDDFLHFQQRAHQLGMELALDFAIQVSPDHPWVKQHPEWFYHRPDGTIKFAENPPKKYEDIYPLNFGSSDWKNLWAALRDVVLFWTQHGVRIFRVDNPHTKPLAFWEWLIRDIQQQFPDVIFLSEAFTRPKMMRALAKAGFTQSYTYFTWRNSKAELTEYLTELTQTQMRDFYRANFFANTPDILPHILQFGGRPAFRMRLVLAATLSSVYGIYNGFELCENRPRGWPGTTEYYQDSEMYQHKVWDWDRPGNIVDDVRRINRIRRENPALQLYDNLRFCPTDNDQIIAYFKTSSSNVILCAVNLDPNWTQSAWLDVPVHEWGLASDASYVVHDLLTDARYPWRGATNWVRLDPHVQPAHIFRVEPA
jgi:starch synthase (maltosyl-transferring)